jgi:serine/threonine protein kinase
MIGTQLGRWVIDRELGKGAMGAVYHAHAADSPAEVRAVKVLAPELVRDAVARQRFQRETDVLCNLDHPNIVRFDGTGSDGDTLYYVMEFISGPDCETMSRQVVRWPWSEVLDLAIQVTRGLKYAHDQGVVHRDLKPANILLQPHGPTFEAKIADFGVARLVSQGNLTGSGQFIGTALYMAPEQAAGKQATKRSDFYALGCVLYTMLTGRPPFNGTSIGELVHKHQFAQPEKPSRLLVDLPHDIDELIMQMLSKDPAQRPADGSVLLKRLESIRGKLVRKHNLTDTAFRPPGSKPELTPGTWPKTEVPVTDNPPGPSGLPTLLRAAVLFIGLLLCLGGILYAFVRPRQTADDLYSKAGDLMKSDDPRDWDKASKEYLEPLTLRFPDSPHKAEVDSFRQMMDETEAQRRLLGRGRRGVNPSEAKRFYDLGLSKFQAGDVDGGRKLWKSLTQSFADVPSERNWVRLAKMALAHTEPAPADPDRFKTAREALATARDHRNSGQKEKADAIWRGLEELYGTDPAATDLLDAMRKDRDRKDEK